MLRPGAKYSLSFTTGGLLAQETRIAGRLFLKFRDWGKVRSSLIDGAQIPFRTKSTATRISREIISRLECLEFGALTILVDGTPEERAAMAWIAACRKYQFISDFATSVIQDRIASRRTDIKPADFDRFVETQSLSHPELGSISAATLSKLKQVLFRMLREAGFLTDSGEIASYALPIRIERLESVTQSGERNLFPLRSKSKRKRVDS